MHRAFSVKMTPSLQLDDNVEIRETKSLWIFGYGSLCWRPGFEYNKAVLGHIKGFSRRFWQGNDVHRGTSEKVYLHTEILNNPFENYFLLIITAWTSCNFS